MQEDRGRDYMNARRVAKEYEAVTKGLNRNAPSVPPQNVPDEAKQVRIFMFQFVMKSIHFTTIWRFFKITEPPGSKWIVRIVGFVDLFIGL